MSYDNLSDGVTYWTVKDDRDNKGKRGEFLGILTDDGHPIASRIDDALGRQDWWMTKISKAEYDTYKEFGFKVIDLVPYELWGI